MGIGFVIGSVRNSRIKGMGRYSRVFFLVVIDFFDVGFFGD